MYESFLEILLDHSPTHQPTSPIINQSSNDSFHQRPIWSTNSSMRSGFDVNNNEEVNEVQSRINKNLCFDDLNDNSHDNNLTLSPSISYQQHSSPLVITNTSSNDRPNTSQFNSSAS
jgi:hypothetical protein